MKRFRDVAIALVAVLVLGAGVARGATTTNFSDQWWIAKESGWGAAVLHQWDTLFIDIFVYGTDNKPTWFVAVARHQPDGAAGHVVFGGEVYAVTGPYYAIPFNSVPVVERQVGTITFDADTGNTALLTYSVDGTTVVKNVTRQTWRDQDLSGRYYGGDVGEQTSCGEDDGHWETEDAIDIVHNPDNSITVTFTDTRNRGMTLTGTYSQSGHMGQVVGTVVAPESFTGTATLFEIERSIGGITGRGRMVMRPPGVEGPGGCVWEGRWGGVRR